MAIMFVVTNSKTVKGVTYHSNLLCRSYREDGKIKKEVVANLSKLTPEQIAVLKRQLKGERPVFLENEANPTEVGAGLPHGQILAVKSALDHLSLPDVIGPPCRENELVQVMIFNRILSPHSKLATARWWSSTTLPSFFNLPGADEYDLYDAMDWLHPRQEQIEDALAKRHLHAGDLALYDLSSSYVEGKHCPLSEFGHNRDKKKGKKQINYGLLTDRRGCPVSIQIFPGNTSDTAAFAEVIKKVRNEYKIMKLVFVGDRGMLGAKNIKILKDAEGADWLTALKSVSLKSLLDREEQYKNPETDVSLVEMTSPDGYPEERIVLCRNPHLTKHRRKTRNDLLDRTEQLLEKIKKRVESGTLQGKGDISFVVGRDINKYKMKKHFDFEATDSTFTYSRKTNNIEKEELMDGLYAIRTSVPEEEMSAEDCVRNYKRLTQVERAFRSLKTTDLHVRPIYHYSEERVKTHFFICMLAYYVVWHMKEVWREITFADEKTEEKEKRNPVEPAKRSIEASIKAAKRQNEDGDQICSYEQVLKDLSTHVKIEEQLLLKGEPPIRYVSTSVLTSFQRKALELLNNIKP